MSFFLLRKSGLVLHCMHAFLQYVFAAPVVANAIHGFVSGAKDVDNWCYHLLLLGALRCSCQQLWTTYSRLHCLVKKHQINACGIEFEQVDREFHSYFLLLWLFVTSNTVSSTTSLVVTRCPWPSQLASLQAMVILMALGRSVMGSNFEPCTRLYSMHTCYLQFALLHVSRTDCHHQDKNDLVVGLLF